MCGGNVEVDQLAGYLSSIAATSTESATLRRWAIVFYAVIQGDAVERLVVGAVPVPSEEIDAYIEIAVNWLLARPGILPTD